MKKFSGFVPHNDASAEKEERFAKLTTYKARSLRELTAAFCDLRKGMKVSQSELSSLTGISQSKISAFESGKVAIQLDTFLKILNALDLELIIQSRFKKH